MAMTDKRSLGTKPCSGLICGPPAADEPSPPRVGHCASGSLAGAPSPEQYLQAIGLAVAVHPPHDPDEREDEQRHHAPSPGRWRAGDRRGRSRRAGWPARCTALPAPPRPPRPRPPATSRWCASAPSRPALRRSHQRVGQGRQPERGVQQHQVVADAGGEAPGRAPVGPAGQPGGTVRASIRSPSAPTIRRSDSIVTWRTKRGQEHHRRPEQLGPGAHGVTPAATAGRSGTTGGRSRRTARPPAPAPGPPSRGGWTSPCPLGRRAGRRCDPPRW